MQQNILESIFSKYKKVYIFGKGIKQRRLADLAIEHGCIFLGFVESDEYYKEENETIRLSQMAQFLKAADIGVVVSISNIHYTNIKKQIALNDLPYGNFYFISNSERRIIWGESDRKEYFENYSIQKRQFDEVNSARRDNCINVFCHQHMGDTFILMGLKKLIEKKYGSPVHYILKKGHDCIAELCGIKEYSTIDYYGFLAENEQMGLNKREIDQKNGGIIEQLFSRIPYQGIVSVSSYARRNREFASETETLVDFRAGSFGINCNKLEPKTYLIEPTENLIKIVDSLGGWDKIVLIAPEARSNPQVSHDYWSIIVDGLRKQGLTVVCNAIEEANQLPQTKTIDVSLRDLIALGQRCHSIYSSRSGLCDCLSSRGKSLHVYYPKEIEEKFDYYSINHNFYLNEEVDEIICR
ncbi:hypothetical protein [Butyrivibrio sp. LC3010]|uniref:hypothetical protein n=1 Tax=Butyrivibrio sp. LC3010 TaxID=1280680 RepID=UPI0003FB9A60|nr:hypothetical protein [Butyrivibrio sp. LC3010]